MLTEIPGCKEKISETEQTHGAGPLQEIALTTTYREAHSSEIISIVVGAASEKTDLRLVVRTHPRP